mgnify:CR=1 FL=1
MKLLNRTELSAFSVIIVLLAVLLFPIYWMINTSVMPSEKILAIEPALYPHPSNITFSAYHEVIERKPIFRWFLNSVIVTLGSAGVSIIISILAGYSLSRYNTKGQQIMGYVLLLSRMLPGALLVIPMYIIFSELKLINSYIALILANITAIVPFSTWMMKGFFDGIPLELEESAMIDGCSWLETFRIIVIPLTLPGLAAVAIYAAILSWNEYLFARTLAYDPNRWIFTVGLASFIGEHSVSWANLMAASLIFIAPILILFFFLEPYLVSGMISGSVKD